MAEAAGDFYQRLGLLPGASDEDIRRAWKRLAKEWHPDRNPNDPQAEDRFKALHEAYRVLGDPAQRAAYDARLAGPADRPRAGGAPRPGPSRPRPAAREGGPRPQRDSTEGPRPEAPRPQAGQDLRRHLPLPLERFEGGGSFRVELGSQPPLDLKLPLRIIPGDELVLPGMGLPGRHGGPAGRLILVLHAQLPAGLRLEGSDLHLTVEVDALLLMTGGSYSLRTPKGRNLDLNLPAGSQQGQRIRLKGQGLPAAQGMGDLVLELGARIRPVTGFRARRLAEKLRRLLEEGDSD